jgi:small multidrug resistance pump
MPYVYLFIAIIGEVIGTSLLKTSDGMSRLWPTCASILAYVVTFFFLSITLRTIPTGIAYAIWSGFGIVLITIIGWVFFKQTLDFAAVCGLGLILAGVLVIQLLSKASAH